MYEDIITWEAKLQPGDVLWNPPYVWHAVKNITDAIGVGYRWLTPSYSFKQAPLYATLDLFARNPNIFKSIKLFNEDFNLIQLAETGRLEAYLAEKKKEAAK